jgi:hypothetical protein
MFYLAGFLCYMFFAHFVGDFLLQTRWMGENKSSSLWPLLVHIAVYTLTLIAFGLPLLLVNVPMSVVVGFCLINGLLHMVTDFVTSRCSKWAFQNKKLGLFWAVIGFDQFVHTATFLLVLAWFLTHTW